jgi:hypothetical protein
MKEENKSATDPLKTQRASGYYVVTAVTAYVIVNSVPAEVYTSIIGNTRSLLFSKYMADRAEGVIMTMYIDGRPP